MMDESQGNERNDVVLFLEKIHKEMAGSFNVPLVKITRDIGTLFSRDPIREEFKKRLQLFPEADFFGSKKKRSREIKVECISHHMDFHVLSKEQLDESIRKAPFARKAYPTLEEIVRPFSFFGEIFWWVEMVEHYQTSRFKSWPVSNWMLNHIYPLVKIYQSVKRINQSSNKS